MINLTAAQNLFDQLTDDQLISVAQHHVEKFNRAWDIVMSSHYRSSDHFNALDSMEREYEVLGVMSQYIQQSRIQVYGEFCMLA